MPKSYGFIRSNVDSDVDELVNCLCFYSNFEQAIEFVHSTVLQFLFK